MEPLEPAAETPSNGCTAGGSSADGPQTLDVDGQERAFILSLPEGYDPTTPYPLIFAFHGLGGSAELVSSNGFYFGIEQTGGKPSIFVYPDGLDTGMGTGWANDGGQDVAFFDALLAHLQQNYCVDSARVFSTGHSFGGMMTHTLACQRADVLRGIAPVAGAYFGFGGGDCAGPVAAWGAHGDPDDTVSYESGWTAIQRVMEANGCDPDSGMPVEATELCTLYACDAGYPVTWCVHDENHNWPEFARDSIKQFFDSF
jgi:poly(3-hydroxybutyrate) depolymerase